MPVSKVKNIVILVLLLADLMLLALLVPGRIAQGGEGTELRRSLSALYEKEGIALNTETIPDAVPLYAVQLGENTSAQLQAAGALLGEQMVAEADSTRHLSSYRSVNGVCSVGRDGSFLAQLKQMEAKTAVQILEDMGFEWESLSEPLSSQGKEQVTATQSVLGVPVFSGGLTLSFANGGLETVEGRFFFGTDMLTRVSEGACISEADALVAFLAARYQMGWVGEEIRTMKQGYLRAETASASVVQLNPVWRLETDSGTFYVDGLTGEVSAAKE